MQTSCSYIASCMHVSSSLVVCLEISINAPCLREFILLIAERECNCLRSTSSWCSKHIGHCSNMYAASLFETVHLSLHLHWGLFIVHKITNSVSERIQGHSLAMKQFSPSSANISWNSRMDSSDGTRSVSGGILCSVGNCGLILIPCQIASLLTVRVMTLPVPDHHNLFSQAQWVFLILNQKTDCACPLEGTDHSSFEMNPVLVRELFSTMTFDSSHASATNWTTHTHLCRLPSEDCISAIMHLDPWAELRM